MFEATVIVAAWNAEASLARSVESAAAQADVSLEIIIVDDASPDGTFAEAERLARALTSEHVAIVPVRLATNAGPAGARNAGLARARGAWVAVLDADDTMEPGRLRRLIDWAEAQGADVVCDNIQPVSPEGAPLGPPAFDLCPDGASVRWSLLDYLAGNQAKPGVRGFGYLKPVIRTAFLQSHGLRYNPKLRNGEDFHLILAMLLAGAGLWFLNHAGYRYTTGGPSISNKLNPEHAAALVAADDAVLDTYAHILGPDGIALMRSRRRRIADLATAEVALQGLRARRIGQTLRVLVTRPRAAGRFLKQLFEATRRRIAPPPLAGRGTR